MVEAISHKELPESYSEYPYEKKRPTPESIHPIKSE